MDVRQDNNLQVYGEVKVKTNYMCASLFSVKSPKSLKNHLEINKIHHFPFTAHYARQWCTLPRTSPARKKAPTYAANY